MKRRSIFYLVSLAALLLLLGSSVEFHSLEAKRAEERAERFDPAQYARDFWDRRRDGMLETALDAEELIDLLNTDMEAAVSKGRTLGQSRVHAYLLAGEGRIVSIDKDGLCVSITSPHADPEILICAGSYISGNAVRDASGLVDVSTFSDTMKFNKISFEINRIVVQEVIKPFLDRGPRAGRVVRFVEAAEVAEDATEAVPFGSRKKESESDGAYHLLKLVPLRLDLESSSGILVRVWLQRKTMTWFLPPRASPRASGASRRSTALIWTSTPARSMRWWARTGRETPRS